MPNKRRGLERKLCLGSKTDLNPKDHWFWGLPGKAYRFCEACNRKKDRIFVPPTIHDYTEESWYMPHI